MEERFWAKVDRSGDCWLWTAAVVANRGYGMFSISGRLTLAHRVSYELANGSIPPGMQVDHTCHVRRCVNPAHLRLATPKQNSENRMAAQRNSKSGVRGVFRHTTTGRWYGQVTHDGRKVHVGYFDDLADAEAAVIAKRSELFTHNVLDRTP